MTTPLIIPENLWDEDEATGSSLIWLVEDGAEVTKGDLIAEILVEKLTMELEAPASGRLRIGIQPESVVNKGDQIGTIE